MQCVANCPALLIILEGGLKMQIKVRITTEAYGKEVEILNYIYCFTNEELDSFIKLIQSSINRMNNKRIVNERKQKELIKEMPAM
jgi:hypothetical protein